MIKIKEIDIQNAILEYLSYKNIFHYRQNTGAFMNDKRGFYRFGVKGSTDIICVIKGRYIGVEVKTPQGKQTPYQKEFQEGLEKAGGSYLLVHSLDEFIAELSTLK